MQPLENNNFIDKMNSNSPRHQQLLYYSYRFMLKHYFTVLKH